MPRRGKVVRHRTPPDTKYNSVWVQVMINKVMKCGKKSTAERIVYEAMGMPSEYFTVVFAVPRMAGWLAQWQEMILDKEQKIARPRQVYTGVAIRDYEPIEKRSAK